MEIIRLKSGLVKLCAEKASTAVIGNWGILEAVTYISEQFDGQLDGYPQITAKVFMGKKKTSKSKLEVAVSKKDTEVQIQQQWDMLRYD